ncbi:Rrf2 family transcriptional regulator [Rhizobium sp. RM]|uniref:RrF2 family transcriptional regulator n=1 Tax=Rhizobium sp. RM TaxID=2748079 RepID=UPI00110E2A7D|nr:Rrf2 family transcriptional regulator [Rhizobium sp. RM]NWJ23928.1 Rrf2 family transcriptional regulator [Rhizobium sp. RM]TMV11209.1 hypothetical protein BJG94_26230 [Rhizobium sp. Td3]
MHLKRETVVAIFILVACARSNGGRVKTAEAAEAANTSKEFAAHVALKLVTAGFLETKRGRNGGLELSRPAGNILLGDILSRFQLQTAASRQLDEDSFLQDGVLDFHKIIAGADRAAWTYLDRFSIADLAGLD